MHYNEALADKQGISEVSRVALDATYEQLFYALEHPEVFDSVEDVVRELEYDLQALWKFPQDAKFHRYQLEIKGCTCPKMDNFELIGHTTDRYRTSDCPWHWTAEIQAAAEKTWAERDARRASCGQ